MDERRSVPISTRKVLLVGPIAVGKTSFQVVLTSCDWPGYMPMMLDPFNVKRTLDKEEYDVTFWETVSLAEYDHLRPLMYPGTDVVMACFSLNTYNNKNEDTFQALCSKCVPEISHHAPGVPFVVVGLQSDLQTTKPQSDFRARAMALGAAGYIECTSRYHGLSRNTVNQPRKVDEFTKEVTLMDVVDLLLECSFNPRQKAKRKVFCDIANHFGYDSPFVTAPVPPQEPTRDSPASTFTSSLQTLYGLKNMCDITFLPNDGKPGTPAHKFIIPLVCPEFWKAIEPLVDPKTCDCKLDIDSETLGWIIPSIYFWSMNAPSTTKAQDSLKQFSQKYNFPLELATATGLPNTPHPLHSFVIDESLESKAKNTRFYDVSLTIDYRLMYAHWPLLISRSFFFQNLSESFQPQRGSISKIPLDHTTVVSHSVWTQILTYIYTDQFEEGSNLGSLIDLYQQCDRYMLGPHAQHLVEDKIKAHIDVGKVVSLWEIVKDTKMEFIKEYCMYLMCLNEDLKLQFPTQQLVAQIMKDKGWADQQEVNRYAQYQEAMGLLEQGKKPYKGFAKEMQDEKCQIQ